MDSVSLSDVVLTSIVHSSNGTNPSVLPDGGTSDKTWLYFLALLIIMLVHRAVGMVFYRLGVPRIIGDIVAGCCLGPTIMGYEANRWLFPEENRAIILMFGQFGLIMTSMSAGFAFDLRVMKGRAFKVVLYTFLNMAVPAVVAVMLYYVLPDTPNWRGVQFAGPAFFVLVVCAMSSSALPMVFLILDELRVNNETSRFAIGLSCLSTVGLFTLLSVVAVLSDPTLSRTLIAIRLLFLALVFIFLYAVQWVWGYFITRAQQGRQAFSFLRYGSDDMAILVIALGLGSAIASERLGYTFLLGAFLAGAAVPHDVGLRANIGEKIRWMTRWIFLPQFFVSSGLNFDLRSLKAESVPYVLLFLVLAFAAKAVLIPVSHYLLKIGWREAIFCASLANCRGFNALIVAQFGQQFDLIGPSFYITCVLLSITSTLATGPLAKAFKPEDDTGISNRTAFARAGHTHTASGSLLDSNTDDGEEGTPQTPSDACEEDREAVFSSWLSDHYDARSKVLVLLCEDVRSRLRDPTSTLQKDTSTGEIRFRGDLLVDYLCQVYSIAHRSVGVVAGQRLLEAGVIAPVEAAVFTDKPIMWACG